MKIYLVGEQGHRTAFKITTAHVVTSLDSIIKESILSSLEKWPIWWDSLKDVYDYTLRGWNIYVASLEDMKNTAKKVKDNEQVAIVKDYLKNNQDLYTQIKKKIAEKIKEKENE